MASIIARMAAPGSERASWRWLCERSALGELLGVDFERMSMMRLYRASDALLAQRAAIEAHLFDLGGDNIGTRKTPNVFSIRVPVAIAIGLRGANAQRTARQLPCDTQRLEEKVAKQRALGRLEGIADSTMLDWSGATVQTERRPAPTGTPPAPFLPTGNGEFFTALIGRY